MPKRLRGKRWLPWVAAGLGVLVVALGVAYLVLSGRQGDISHPNVEFDAGEQPAAPVLKAGRNPADDGASWPLYGFNKQRTRSIAVPAPIHPPYVQRWAMRGSVLLEFPPVMCDRSLYLLKNDGALYAISRLTGRVRWKAKIGSLAASSPACAHGTVYAVALQRYRGSKGGRVVAVAANDGHTRWSRKLPSRAESSPLVDKGSVFFGTEDGTVYRLRARDGYVRWRYKASGAVKAGLALYRGKLYFGDYGGHVQAVDELTGRRVWDSGTSGGPLGLTSGSFYSTPAVAFGRVYAGNTDGSVYSFSARTGKLAWRKHTGGYVYSSPAVSTDGSPPTIFIGSYDGHLYALNARSGAVRWSRPTNKISGGPVVIGDLVFYSTLAHDTAAVGAAHGSLVWHTNRGAFNPVVSDGRRIYLVGYSSLFLLETRAQARRDRRAIARYRASVKAANASKRAAKARAKARRQTTKR